MNNKTINEEKEEYVPKGSTTVFNINIAKAKNAEVWTIDNERYIDFFGGIGSLNTGHMHEKIKQAIIKQLECFSHTGYQILPYEIYTSLAKKLVMKSPIKSAKNKAVFFTTGTEAIENAVKIAKLHTKRYGIISFTGAFHGRTNLSLALTGKVNPYKIGVGPFPYGIFHASYPNKNNEISTKQAINDLQKILACDIEPQNVAAIIIEPLQGEGGFNITDFNFLKELRKIADENKIVLIFDEIQSGFARTGKFFATEYSGVEPDIITVAKSLAGGFPLSGLVGKASILDSPKPGALGGTYAGNPIALAAANTVFDIIEEENLCEKSIKLGEYLVKKINELKNKIPNILEIRGLGSMLAIEFIDENKNPDPKITKKIIDIAFNKKLLLINCGEYKNIIRFLYPLTIEQDIFDEGISILIESIIEATK